MARPRGSVDGVDSCVSENAHFYRAGPDRSRLADSGGVILRLPKPDAAENLGVQTVVPEPKGVTLPRHSEDMEYLRARENLPDLTRIRL